MHIAMIVPYLHKEFNVETLNFCLLKIIRLKVCLFLAQLGASEFSWKGGDEVGGGTLRKLLNSAASRIQF